METYNQDKSKYANNKGLQELVEKFNLNQKSIEVPQEMISVEEEVLANKVFECFEKKRLKVDIKEQIMKIQRILHFGEIRLSAKDRRDSLRVKRIVNWRHTEVTSSCSHDSMSSLPGLGQVEGRMDSSACGG